MLGGVDGFVVGLDHCDISTPNDLAVHFDPGDGIAQCIQLRLLGPAGQAYPL